MPDKKTTNEVMKEIVRIAEENGVQLVAVCGDPERMRNTELEDGATMGVYGTAEMVFYTILWLDSSHPKVFNKYMHVKAMHNLKGLIEKLTGNENQQQGSSGEGEDENQQGADDFDLDSFMQDLLKKGNPGDGKH